jgi:hypothetical protein
MDGVLSSGMRFCVRMWVTGGSGRREIGDFVAIVDDLRVLRLIRVKVKDDRSEVM